MVNPTVFSPGNGSLYASENWKLRNPLVTLSTDNTTAGVVS